MSVFRIEKNKNYTAMSNYHFQDINLSLKAIGLLSKMLSLPDNWDYSQAGLAKICKDGEDSISSALKELEKNGYLVRERTRDANGRMGGMIYHVYEVPKHLLESGETQPEAPIKKEKSKTKGIKEKSSTPSVDLPRRENPVMVNPVMDNPTLDVPELDNPSTENHGQLNINKQITNSKNNNSINLSINHYAEQEVSDGLIDGQNSMVVYENWQTTFREKVGYDYFIFQNKKFEEKLEEGTISLEEFDIEMLSFNIKTLDKIIDYIVEIMMSSSKEPLKIGSEYIDREVVKSKLMKIDMMKVKTVIRQLNTTSIKNPKNYAISMLYNS